ncbi:MAG: RIP metalloprotease RseP [Alphaproteobacteria bacterium]|nr:RIP metalloprotease RseP [Alphaproteobacteria bacterium]
MSLFDLFQLIASNIWFYGGVFILVLSVLVFVHEWGHYIVARLCGVRVETFSIGFGKELFGYTDAHGTRWKFSLIPLGGYVKMFGDTDPASSGHLDEVKEGEKIRPMSAAEKKEAFFAKPVAQRAAIVFAGPAINFLFAILLLFGLYSFYGQPVTPPMASAVIVGSAADKGGFEPHDKILSIDGQEIKRFEDIRRIVMVALDTPLEFEIKRGEEVVVLTATPEKQELTDRFGFSHSRGMLGIIGPSQGLAVKNITAVNGREIEDPAKKRQALLSAMSKGKPYKISLKRGEETTDGLIVNPLKELNEGLSNEESLDYNALVVANKKGEEVLRHGLLNGMRAAVTETWGITRSTLHAIGQIFTGTRSATELGGIIRIGAIAGDMAQSGFLAIVTFTALLSINLGLINLFPIPMLDGGHLVFYSLEAVKGKPISEKAQEVAFRFGFVLLVGMMIFANLNDIVQLIM